MDRDTKTNEIERLRASVLEAVAEHLDSLSTDEDEKELQAA